MNYLLALTFILAPAYVLRFNLSGLPANLLMIWLLLFPLLVFIHMVKTQRLGYFFRIVSDIPRPIQIAAVLFFVSGIISLFVGGVSQEKLGQWIVLFVQPFLTFLCGKYLVKIFPKNKDYLIWAMFIFLGVSGFYALLQYFALIGLPPDWTGNANEPKRAISFFVHPNAYALFIAPILGFLLPDLWQKIISLKVSKYFLKTSLWTLGAFGLLLSLSRGGWLGLAFAAAAFVFFSGQKALKKIAVCSFLSLLVVVALVPNFRYRVLLPFQGEKSSVARLSLWHTGWSMVKDEPVLGKGLSGFSQNWFTYNTDPNLDHYNFPHNIFLNFWVDTGFLGMLSFIGLCIVIIFYSFRKQSRNLYLPVGLFVIALIAHGLIDIPYLKNDLAVVFWLALALT